MERPEERTIPDDADIGDDEDTVMVATITLETELWPDDDERQVTGSFPNIEE